jgi:hypothetical protein
MQKFSRKSVQSVFRAVVLLGVLTGLLFSCGEGIRLFPFPPEATGYKHSGWQSGDAIVYQKNLHRFENKQENSPSKIQRDNHQHYWTNAAGAPNDAPLSSLSSARRIDVLFDPAVFRSRLFSFSRASRAPPRQS